MSITNTDRRILVEIRRRWGGILARRSDRNPEWKPSYALIWTNAQAETLLSHLAPHLRIKGPQAAAILDFTHRIHACKRRRDPAGRLLPHLKRELSVREAFHMRLKALNRRGSATPARSDPRDVRASLTQGQWRISGEYLAGFVDAEGSLMIMRSKQQWHPWPRYTGRICVSNTKYPVLEAIRRTYGGALVNQRAPNEAWSDAYQVVWSEGAIGRMLELLTPKLRIKRRQAAVLAQFMRHKARFTGLPPKSKPSREQLSGSEALYRQMKHLNAKGPPHSKQPSPGTRRRTKTPRA